jgi:hypothetical protein
VADQLDDNWPDKYPWSLLPRGGTHPYEPPKGNWLKNPPKGPLGGYVDANGNEWVPDPPPQSGDLDDFHWDVQHANGGHTNIRPDGEIHHGADNF